MKDKLIIAGYIGIIILAVALILGTIGLAIWLLIKGVAMVSTGNIIAGILVVILAIMILK